MRNVDSQFCWDAPARLSAYYLEPDSSPSVPTSLLVHASSMEQTVKEEEQCMDSANRPSTALRPPPKRRGRVCRGQRERGGDGSAGVPCAGVPAVSIKIQAVERRYTQIYLISPCSGPGVRDRSR